jgi:hypothetical protein
MMFRLFISLFFITVNFLSASQKDPLVPYVPQKSLLSALATKSQLQAELSLKQRQEAYQVQRFLQSYEFDKQANKKKDAYQKSLTSLQQPKVADTMYEDIMKKYRSYAYNHSDGNVQRICFELQRADVAADKSETSADEQYWQTFFAEQQASLQNYVQQKVEYDIAVLTGAIATMNDQIMQQRSVRQESQIILDNLKLGTDDLKASLDLVILDCESLAKSLIVRTLLGHQRDKNAAKLLAIEHGAAQKIQSAWSDFGIYKAYQDKKALIAAEKEAARQRLQEQQKQEQALQAYRDLQKQDEERRLQDLEERKAKQRADNEARKEKEIADKKLLNKEKKLAKKEKEKKKKGRAAVASAKSEPITDDDDLVFLDHQIEENKKSCIPQAKAELVMTPCDTSEEEPEESIFLPIGAKVAEPQASSVVVEMSFDQAHALLVPQIKQRRLELVKTMAKMKISTVPELHQTIARSDGFNRFYNLEVMTDEDIVCAIAAMTTDLLSLSCEERENVILWDDLFMKMVAGNARLWTHYSKPLCSCLPEETRTLRKFKELYNDLSETCKDMPLEVINSRIKDLKEQLQEVLNQRIMLGKDPKKNKAILKKSEKDLLVLNSAIEKQTKLLSLRLHYHVMSKIDNMLYPQPDIDLFHKVSTLVLDTKKIEIENTFESVVTQSQSIDKLSKDEVLAFSSAICQSIATEFLVFSDESVKNYFVESLAEAALSLASQKGPKKAPDNFIPSMFNRIIHNHIKAGQEFEKNGVADFTRLYGHLVQILRYSSFACDTEFTDQEPK